MSDSACLAAAEMNMVHQRYRLVCFALLLLASGCTKPDSAAAPTPTETAPAGIQFAERPDQPRDHERLPPATVQTDGATKLVFGPDLLPVSDSVILRFDWPISELSKRSEFGIFRDLQDRSVQWIEETLSTIDGPWLRPSKWLKIHYEVLAPGSSNGWALKCKDEDWSKAQDGALVLRLRVDGDWRPTFKLELKTSAGSPQVHAQVVELGEDSIAELKRRGFMDVSIPLRQWVRDAKSLAKIDELVMSFEHDRVTQNVGDIYLHSVRLALPRLSAPKDADQLAEQLAEGSFRWFAANRHPRSGLVLDRSPTQALVRERPTMCSIAGVGFYLSMLPEVVRRKQMDETAAVKQAEETLSFVLHRVPHQEGLLPHFLHWESGKPMEWSEYSALDTAIFLNGCCVVSEAFGGKVRQLADALLDRVNWKALVVRDSKSGKELLSFGWSPKKVLLGPMHERSSEMAIAYCLAIGSRSHPVDPELWYGTEIQYGERHGYKLLNPAHGLFTSYYGLAWADLRGLADRGAIDFEDNARIAALANRAFCRHAGEKTITYQARFGGWWGISAGDSPTGYIAPGLVDGDAAGTVWPTAALAAWPWVRVELKTDLARWRSSEIWPVVYGPYGLAPFNLDAQWIGVDSLAIDLGSFYLNYADDKSGAVRRLWMKHPVSMAAIRRLGLRATK